MMKRILISTFRGQKVSYINGNVTRTFSLVYPHLLNQHSLALLCPLNIAFSFTYFSYIFIHCFHVHFSPFAAWFYTVCIGQLRRAKANGTNANWLPDKECSCRLGFRFRSGSRSAGTQIRGCGYKCRRGYIF
ncbi:GD17860 [Drosophila simulans]|uniref:GD17860 n=1 Tax=Drosophila simulans TaxID=7240 RepID=B4NTQ8_DROSI|nr:GD17860 [Drosophila simulans]